MGKPDGATFAPPWTEIDAGVFATFETAKGFMPADEGLALYAAAVEAARLGLPLLEIGSYCGRSTLLLAEAARRAGTVAVTVDHHRGSEEQQPGEEYHDPELADPADPGRMDTLPAFRRTLAEAGLEEHVIAVVGTSPRAAAALGGGGGGRFGLVFIDGGHTDAHATADFESWVPQLAPGGLLVIHDVFPDPADGGQAPFRVWRRAVDSGAFTEAAEHGSLRVLRRTQERSDSAISAALGSATRGHNSITSVSPGKQSGHSQAPRMA